MGTGPFARSHRLLKPADFKRVFAEPCKSIDDKLTVLARRNAGIMHPRLGLAISKKHLKKAVQRNRIKRLVRESFRHHQAILGNLDIVVMARNGSIEASNDELAASLKRHWKRLSQRCDGS